MPLDEALARSVVDLSGRPYIVFESPVDKELLLVTKDFPFALVEEFWKSAAFRGKFNLHVDVIRAKNGHHAAEAVFKSAARAATGHGDHGHGGPLDEGDADGMTATSVPAVTLVDYGVGNTASVIRAFRRLGSSRPCAPLSSAVRAFSDCASASSSSSRRARSTG